MRGLKHIPAEIPRWWKLSHPSWVRGLKHAQTPTMSNRQTVAPLVGAWIETIIRLVDLRLQRSHPSWVRGLKHLLHNCRRGEKLSHPSWVRGLKLTYTSWYSDVKAVAPLVGAWIETQMIAQELQEDQVAPLVGAWIETPSPE